ncbi:hypothetical protein [Pseudomonas kilonensis]
MESAVFFGFWGGVYIRYLGNGSLWFRSYGGSLLEEAGAGPAKSNQKRFAPPLGTSLRLGIHAEVPTAQCLRSASVV